MIGEDIIDLDTTKSLAAKAEQQCSLWTNYIARCKSSCTRMCEAQEKKLDLTFRKGLCI
jgi:hypothetical protein